MFCNKCGEILRDNARRCPVCGASQEGNSSKINEDCDCGTGKKLTFDINRPKTHSSGGSWSGKTFRYDQTQSAPSPRRHHGRPSGKEFIQLILNFYKGFLNFGGRSTRWEYWWTRLFIVLASMLVALSDGLAVLWILTIPLPYIALHIRRLHDIGRSGWWYLLKFVPIAGELILDIWFCLPSVPSNRWGAKPYV